VGFWERIFSSRKAGGLQLSNDEFRHAATLRKAGISDDVIGMQIRAERARKEMIRAQATENTSTAPTHGVEIGRVFQCAECGRRMQKIGIGRGSMMMSMAELMSGEVGPAEECRECGRAYCTSCYQNRPHKCVCGVNQDAVRMEDNVTYRGSLFLIKVKYQL
jgi:hypothetical protein